jgi:hypothetical protein
MCTQTGPTSFKDAENRVIRFRGEAVVSSGFRGADNRVIRLQWGRKWSYGFMGAESG